MRTFIIILFFIYIGIPVAAVAKSSTARLTPTEKLSDPSPGVLAKLLSMKVKDVENYIGKKLSLKEKIVFKLARQKLKNKFHKLTEKRFEKDKGEVALTLGIIALSTLVISLFLPYLLAITLPCALAGLIIGYSVKKKEPDNKKARTAILLSWITIIGLILIILLLLIFLIFAFGNFRFE